MSCIVLYYIILCHIILYAVILYSFTSNNVFDTASVKLFQRNKFHFEKQQQNNHTDLIRGPFKPTYLSYAYYSVGAFAHGAIDRRIDPSWWAN